MVNRIKAKIIALKKRLEIKEERYKTLFKAFSDIFVTNKNL